MDVLVAGAGPVGLMVAAELLRRGVRVRIVDGARGPATTSRALGTHSRTLEIYDQLGLLDRILSRGRIVTAFERHTTDSEPVRYAFAWNGKATRYDYLLLVDQIITEEVLREHLAALGGRIEWGTRVEAVEQDGDAVRVSVSTPDGHTTIETPWLVGCDGAHSVVRSALGIPLRGDSSATWMVADARVDVDLDPRTVHWVYGAGGAVMMFPFPERHRWRLVDTTYRPGDDDRPRAIADRFESRIGAGTGHRVQVEDPVWRSAFTIQQRAVPVMQDGRCFVAGDAAHVHSPAGGQGMNTGLQDAFNLGWKLAAVVAGHATPELLGSYSVERVPIGSALLDSTGTVTDYIMANNAQMHDHDLFVQTGRRLLAAASALDLAYPDSPLTVPADGAGAPAPGERLIQVGLERASAPGWQRVFEQLRSPQWMLLVLGGPAPTLPAGHRDWLSVLRLDAPDVAADLGVDVGADGGWLLVRPDGYLTARGAARQPVPLPAGYRAVP